MSTKFGAYHKWMDPLVCSVLVVVGISSNLILATYILDSPFHYCYY